MAESSHKPVREGFLSKRQRGKKVVLEAQRKKLKFEERYCILTSTELTYRKGKETARKGSLPVGNIKIVEQVEAGTFTRQKCDFCFQVGDHSDMIYLVAKDAVEMMLWMNDIRKAAKQNQNTMADKYHPGAYGSIRKEKWSCCGRSGVSAEGCEMCNTSGNPQNEIDSLAKSYNSRTQTPGNDINPNSKAKWSNSYPRTGAKQSVTTLNSFMTTSGESDYNGDTSDYTSGEELPAITVSEKKPQHEESPGVMIEDLVVQNLNEDDMLARSRTNTQKSITESGIDTDHGSRLNSNASVMSQSRAESDSTAHEDDGIDLQFDDQSPTPPVPSQSSSNILRTQSAGKSSLTTVSHISVRRNVSSRISSSSALDAVQEEDADANMNLNESYVLSQPISAVTVTLMDSESKIITGTMDGMVRIWTASLENKTKDKWTPMLQLTKSLRVSGEVTSLDVYGDYLAVGSNLAQMIYLSNPELPRKAFIADQKTLFSASHKQKQLISFAKNLRLNEEPLVVTASIGGDRINVWKLPSWEDGMPFVMKPDFSFSTSGAIQSILCTKLPSTNDWVGVVAVEHIREKAAVNVHMLNLQTKNQKQDVIYEESISHRVHATFLHSGRKFAIGCGKQLQIWDTDKRCHLESLTQRDTITGVHYSEGRRSLNSGYLAVGLENGDVNIFHKRKQYTQIQTYSPDTPELETTLLPAPAVVNLCFDNAFSWGVIVRPKGSLEVWQANTEQLSSPKVTNHPTLGMELENEGFISQLEIVHHDKKSGQGITSSGSQMEMKDQIGLEIPNEVCINDGVFAVEFGAVVTSPLGPFVFPERLSSYPHLVSPIFWVCSVPQTENRFTKQAKLKIPLCSDIDIDKGSKNHLSNSYRLIKADHRNVELNKLGQRVIFFEDVTSEYADKLTYNCETGTFSLTVSVDHFCVLCLFEENTFKSGYLDSINYCLTILVPRTPDKHESYNIYCILHYNLPTCKRLICEKQFNDFKDYKELHVETFSFGGARDTAVLSVEADTLAAELLGWQILFDSPQEIEAKRVNFLTFDAYRDNLAQLQNDCYVQKTYPPRFVIRVMPQNAWSDSKFKLTFRGADRVIEKEIDLVFIRDRLPPSVPRPEEEEKRPNCRQFRAENGYWTYRETD